MDYNLQTMLIALVAHRKFEGGGTTSVTLYATDLFSRFDAHIRTAATAAGRTFDPNQRTVIAGIAALAGGGTPAQAAQNAVATFIHLFAN